MQETCERIVEYESSRHGKNSGQLPTRTQSYLLSFRRGARARVRERKGGAGNGGKDEKVESFSFPSPLSRAHGSHD